MATITRSRSYFANVYETGRVGCPHSTRGLADCMGMGIIQTPFPGDLRAKGIAFRIHVRLKPEGAPKRYASEANRQAWERDPKRAAVLSELFAMGL